MEQRITPELILEGLGTARLPRAVRYYPLVESTMDLARKALAEEDEASFPLLLVADEQSLGRGRLGRPWIAPPATALLFSLALRPARLPPGRAAALVWMAGVALAEGIAEVSGLRPALKWPNDVLLPFAEGPAWRKAAGILLEVSGDQQAIEWAILGCGINVSACPPPDTVRYPAGHLAEAGGGPVDRLALLRALLRRFDHWYAQIEDGNEQTLFSVWRGMLQTIGQPVAIETGQGTISGLAEGVEPSGALLVREPSGTLHRVSSGDVGLIAG